MGRRPAYRFLNEVEATAVLDWGWNQGWRPGPENTGLAWQIGVWDAMAQRYGRDVDRRFRSVVEGVVQFIVGALQSASDR
jgi:hypothetical protein